MPVRVLLISLVLLFQAYPAVFGSDGQIELMAGFDGANPQNQEDIIFESANRFRIRPFNENGSNDAYWFRLNTLIMNHGSKTEDVELIVEWPALQENPDFPYDYYFYGDMGEWHPVRATIKGTEACLVVPARPGKTFIGFCPRYSYGYYLQFIESLSAESPFLKKWIQGNSACGREIWCLRLTDPEVPPEGKAKILISARNHPYETSCSYITEEAVLFLLGNSEQARKALRENDIYLMPMINPDGVALGMNQRTGPDGVNMSFAADTDVPEIKALENLVEEMRPDIWVDIHSWPHEGDDGMWCTHQWVADGLLAELPDSSFQDYVWKVSFVQERNTAENHLWKWLIRTYDSGGVSLSFSWFRRTEEDVRMIGRRLIVALGAMMSKR